MSTTSRGFGKAMLLAALAAACVFAPSELTAQHGGGHPQPAMRSAPPPSFHQQQPAYRPPQPSYHVQQQPAFRPQQGYRPEPYGQPMRPQQQPGMPPVAPIERRAPQGAPPRTLPQASAASSSAPPNMQFRGNHLNEWMTAHSNLSPAQQHAALDREPGFRDLPQPTQQRLHDRLSQLDAMTPQQRQHMIANTEAMERLTPAQRADVRSSMLQLGALPPPQRAVVSRAFRDLRGLPPQERLSVLNSRYRDLDPQSRAALEHLMQVEPMLPPPER